MTMHVRPVESAQGSSSDSLFVSKFNPHGRGIYRQWTKRILDIAVVLLALPSVLLLLAPLCLLIATDGHSPFYRQKRIGRNGKIFYMWKLRSMVHDAEGRLQAHLDDPGREHPRQRFFRFLHPECRHAASPHFMLRKLAIPTIFRYIFPSGRM